MEYSNNNQINGLPKYAFYGQEDRVEELNKTEHKVFDKYNNK